MLTIESICIRGVIGNIPACQAGDYGIVTRRILFGTVAQLVEHKVEALGLSRFDPCLSHCRVEELVSLQGSYP